MSDTEIASSGSIKIAQTATVSIPPNEQWMVIRRSDWKRIFKKVSKCQINNDWSGWYFCLFGVAASMILAVPSFWSATNIPTWIIPAYLIGAFAALFLGCTMMHLNKKELNSRKEHLEELTEDMKELEDNYEGQKAQAEE